MSFIETLNTDFYNSGPMDLNSIDSGFTGCVAKIKESENPIVSAVREYWDSALSFAAGYLFSGVSAAMIAGGLAVDYISKRNGESESPFEDYLPENIPRFARNTSLFFSGLYFAGPLEPKYVGIGLLLSGAGYVSHRWHKSLRIGSPEEE
jgi:hypothetical protein